MARVIAICLAVLLVGAGAARADKPRIAVLGLEVAHRPSEAIDPRAQRVAADVTRELRRRVQAPASPYARAPNSDKDLRHEKALMSCETEALDCMIVIGAGLASDALLYGRVEKKGAGFRIALKLLDVRRKQVHPAADDLPGGRGGAASVARRLYQKLTADAPPSEGSLVVRARSDTGVVLRTGTVYVDDRARGTLRSGALTVNALAAGRHTVAIHVGGYRRYEEMITLRAGERATVNARLHIQSLARTSSFTGSVTPPQFPAVPPPAAPVPPAAAPATLAAAAVPAPATLAAAAVPAPVVPAAPERPAPIAPPPAPAAPASADAAPASRLWQLSLLAGGATLLAGGGFAWYSDARQHDAARGVNAKVDSSRCGDSDGSLVAIDAGIDLAAFRRACTWHDRTILGVGIAAIGATAAVVSLILMDRAPRREALGAARRRGTAREAAIAPVLLPGGAGAQLSLPW